MAGDYREKSRKIAAEPPVDHLRAAVRTVAAAALATGLAAGFLAAFLWLYDPHCRPAARWLRAQRLDGPALLPSGAPGHHRQLAHPGVPLRHDPTVPEITVPRPARAVDSAAGSGRQS